MKLTVYGTPAPQGSKRHVGNGIMVESSKKVKPWREAVKWAAIEHMGGVGKKMIRGPVSLTITFYLPKPKRPQFTSPANRPDIDKLTRSTCDALTAAGCYEDDSRVVMMFAEKVYAGSNSALPVPGAVITIMARGE